MRTTNALVSGIKLAIYQKNIGKELDKNILRELIPTNTVVINIKDDRTKLTEDLLSILMDIISEDIPTMEIIQRMTLIFGSDDDGNIRILNDIDDLTEDNEKEFIKIIRNYKYKSNVILILEESLRKMKSTTSNYINPNTMIKIKKVTEDRTDTGDFRDALIESVDISNEESLVSTLATLKDKVKYKVFKTGYVGINEMTQGGLRTGESVIVEGLQYNYKTGLTLTMFLSILMYNKFESREEGKMPLAVWMSFEDKLSKQLKIAYRFIYAIDNDGKLPDVDIDKLDIVLMAKTIKNRLLKNGIVLKFERHNPTKYSYTKLFDQVTYWNKTYDLQILDLDALYHIPRIGCDNTGPMGTDLRDLFRRVFNNAEENGYLLISSHQMNTKASDLLKEGVADVDLVKMVENKGYTEGSGQLNQEIGLELYVKVARVGDKDYLCVQRGKHKLETMIPNKFKFLMMPFPETDGEILPDIELDKPIHIRDSNKLIESSW